MSELGKSLRGDSLIAFDALSDKQRSQLVDLVDSGKMSGEEVHDALKQRLKQARSSAVSATQRMFANDHAELLAGGNAGPDELRDALGATLERRSSLMDKLKSALSQDGVQEASAALAARELNPLLAQGQGGLVGLFAGGGADSRLLYTRKEGDAAYKMKSLGVDLDGIDAALRGIGEKDAAAILSERAGLPSSRSVSADPDFSEKDAAFLPYLSVPDQNRSGPALGGEADRMRALYGAGRRQAVGAGIYQIDGGQIDRGAGSPRAIDVLDVGVPVSRPSGTDVSYLKGLLPRY
ncbi:hypothetical protein [Azospirillum picis]|uniref:Uncharacterized protein n=1 Tax=Azospirillum picis TaxID=488438 RepID=A0ABU0MUB5_9PROT|nr:hypothetical protein [Azospirillum picis]MBP2303288.1 hypothetical protein [Azospirillum picis]MDQ0537088.1 hypothetical protein [Azospirillum picis]